jgi:nucleoside-diphosphate-sugar epimerase
MKPRVSGARVLVTGAAGFIGSHLVPALAREGATVHATRLTPDQRPRVPVDVPVCWHDVDLTRADEVASVIRAASPDIVIHLAAYGTSHVQRDPRRLLEVNVYGMWHLLQALPPGTRLVMTGTCAEYGHVKGPAHEGLPCRPASAYPAAKHAAVTLAAAHARETGRPVVVLRPYGPFGPGDDPLRVLPFTMISLIKGEDVVLTDGLQLRDFSYVDNHVEAIVCAAAAQGLEPGAAFNIGTGQATTLRAALERVAALVGGSGRLLFGVRARRPDDLEELVPDITAARRDLGFEPRVPFDEGVRRTVAYLRRQIVSERAS